MKREIAHYQLRNVSKPTFTVLHDDDEHSFCDEAGLVRYDVGVLKVFEQVDLHECTFLLVLLEGTKEDLLCNVLVSTF